MQEQLGRMTNVRTSTWIEQIVRVIDSMPEDLWPGKCRGQNCPSRNECGPGSEALNRFRQLSEVPIRSLARKVSWSGIVPQERMLSKGKFEQIGVIEVPKVSGHDRKVSWHLNLSLRMTEMSERKPLNRSGSSETLPKVTLARKLCLAS